MPDSTTRHHMPYTTDIAVILETVAIRAHEVNRAYCHTLGDASQLTWREAPQWAKDSAIAGVTAILENPDLTPEQSHESWSAMKVADGWVYGETKNPETKTHPCLRPYAELPEEQRLKDLLFGCVVRSFMPTLNTIQNRD